MSNAKTDRPTIPNALADRYASNTMLQLFSPTGRIISERELWIAVMKAQAELGLAIPQKAIAAYEKAKTDVDLDWIRDRERVIRHDQKAKLEAFNKVAGYEYAHLGMTSRDLGDNVEQLQIKQGLVIIRDHTVAVITRMARLAAEYNTLVFPERTHLAAAQPTVAGKIFANFGEELLVAFNRLEQLIESYPLRGIKGAVGTQTDQLQLFDGDTKKVAQLEEKIASFLGFKNVLTNVGQIYPRSLDFEVVSTLYQLICGPANFALTAREMAAFEEFTEGFRKGQVGSSAMPHKMNSRNAERIFAFKNILMGHVSMLAGTAGNQIFAGDVSDSATRRVAIPDAFYTTDGIIETTLTILDECGFYPANIQREMDKYLPFLTTTRLLMTAVKAGIGREKAHEIIKEHAVVVALEMRETGKQNNDLIERLASDETFGLSKETLQKAIANPIDFVGNAPKQIATFVTSVEKITKKYPKAAQYNPGEIV